MNLSSIGIALWQLAGGLAIEIFLIIGAAVLADRLVSSVFWRRTIWQVCFLSLASLWICEATGMSRLIGLPFAADRPSETQSLEESRTNGFEASPRASVSFSPVLHEVAALDLKDASDERKGEDLTQHVSFAVAEMAKIPQAPSVELPSNRSERALAKELDSQHVSLNQAPDRGSEGAGESGNMNRADNLPIVFRPSVKVSILVVWLLGCSLVALRIGVSHCMFLSFHRRRTERDVGALELLIERLSSELGFRRRVRLIETRGLASPIAFGILRPTVGLPLDFSSQFEPAQQEAMIAHELAHLASSDPAWRLITDLVTAVLWWHPAVWLARNRAHVVCELAADEASSLIKNGPTALAESLIVLGTRLACKQPHGTIGVAGGGFQSNLGRRVERLLSVRDRVWRPPHKRHTTIATTFGSITLVTVAIITTAWSNPASFNNGGTTMNTIKHAWRQSVTAFAAAASLTATNGLAQTGARPEPIPQDAESPESVSNYVSESASSSRSMAQPLAQDATIPPEIMRRYGILPSDVSSQPTASDESATVYKSRYGPVLPKERPRFLYKAKGTGSGEEQVAAKLEKIMLDEIFFDGVPIHEVVRFLSEKSRQLDREREGVNFLISNSSRNSGLPATGVDPITSVPLPANSPDPVDLRDVLVRFNLPLRNVSLRHVLDAITKVAEEPVVYTMEDYGVVFSFAPDEPVNPFQPSWEPAATNPLEVRTFRIEKTSLVDGLRVAFGIEIQWIPGAPINTQVAPDPALAGKSLQQALRKLFTELGAILAAPGKSVFYNELTGIMMVRATAEELKIIQAAIETLGGSNNSSPRGSAGMMQMYAPLRSQSTEADQPDVKEPSSSDGVFPGSGEGAFIESAQSSKTVAVLGAVRQPGNFPIPEGQDWTIVQAIAASGGLTKLSNKNRIELRRDGNTERFRFNDLIQGKFQQEYSSATDDNTVLPPALQPGDVVYVQETYF